MGGPFRERIDNVLEALHALIGCFRCKETTPDGRTYRVLLISNDGERVLYIRLRHLALSFSPLLFVLVLLSVSLAVHIAAAVVGT